MSTTALRNLPSIDQLLRRENLRPLIDSAGRDTVRDRLREVLEEFRQELVGSNGKMGFLQDSAALAEEIEQRLMTRFARRRQTQTQRVINATGVILHTNLGRAPLSPSAIVAINEVARDYSNLEYDLAAGARGKRGTGLEATLRELLHCEAAAVVNNCAAAVLITLNTLAEGGEVIVSRGELIEIGGSFRIPDVIAKSGARIREVGTTNRTRLADYENAINENTKVILRAHPSNYRIIGFTEKPALEDLAQLARERGLPLFEDLGSGCLIDLNPLGIHDEPTVAQAIKAGASVVAFSGDKLLGGPQAGIILGEAGLIKRIKSNPLMRALRVDKLTFAALEATVAAYLAGRAIEEIPVQAALHATKETITRRARAFVRRAKNLGETLTLNLIDGASVIGGGSAPETQLPTTLISLTSLQLSASQLEEKLRLNAPSIITRIIEDKLAIDLRTVSPQSEAEILTALTNLCSES
ncbi:MAG: L-seryl-tRNA(Sec) selenium transferase [Acidobacteria bacterium]|nr:L-seryl-tRNA(Sec) selenium transferase [Acidobacteriota bacterium]